METCILIYISWKFQNGSVLYVTEWFCTVRNIMVLYRTCQIGSVLHVSEWFCIVRNRWFFTERDRMVLLNKVLLSREDFFCSDIQYNFEVHPNFFNEFNKNN